jgi:hypothetical protein
VRTWPTVIRQTAAGKSDCCETARIIAGIFAGH